MKQSIFSVAGAVLALGLMAPLAASAQQSGNDAPIYGSELMTQQERLEYRERLRDADGIQERDRIRSEHHEQMLERAHERGVSLPDAPPRGGADMRQDGMPGMGYDGRERMEQQRVEPRERAEERMEHRDRMRDSNGDYRRGSGMGGGGNRN
ncbi:MULTISPECIES: hypothetical protein [unclassified Guyparkeria]|uniref:hypothetical protein n=1 Tax=unclassified Guyparkeria TaxID=2626246 RepID=UPI0007336882|nr:MULTISPECIES: hypothetical protein [unclassified Guyparkeria]KTG15950.1 hypothetical protein AUR63_05710 [Guyparkeria sp. XI15]OAE84705.1 hypothetical protein AWR35_05720 [Guyparkeria sp. WRN-7]